MSMACDLCKERDDIHINTCGTLHCNINTCGPFSLQKQLLELSFQVGKMYAKPMFLFSPIIHFVS